MPAPTRPNTAPARRAKKSIALVQASANGTLRELQTRVWSAINRIDEIISDDSSDPALVLRASHALFQGAAAYSKVLNAGEFEARLEVLENPDDDRRGVYADLSPPDDIDDADWSDI